MKIEQWPLDRIKPYPRNARKIPEAAVLKVAESIKQFGWQQPIVVDENGIILVGHVRRLAALHLKLEVAPVKIEDQLTETQKRAYRLADNRSHEEATWDKQMLAAELGDLQALDVAAFTAFDAEDLMGIKGVTAAAGEDELPEQGAPVTRPGDLWMLGGHRLICGSCTDAAIVSLVLGDIRPELLVTDPPYGVNLEMEWRDRAGHNSKGAAARSYMQKHVRQPGHSTTSISGDDQADWSAAFELVPALRVAYVWHATSKTLDVAAGLVRIGFDLKQQIIWLKTVAAMSRQAYHWKHEPCWFAVKVGQRVGFVGPKDQTTVWEAASPKQIMAGSTEEKWDHPTQKPVVLMERPIANHRGDVYEPFGGSGTTIVAAEKQNRRCASTEIEPRFCDIIVRRWQKFTGKEATLDSYLVHKADGSAERQPGSRATFEHVMQGRQLEGQDAIAEETLA